MLRVEFGDCRLVASWWISILTLAGVVLFTQLGRWQWHRAEEKRALAAAFVAGAADFSSDLGNRSTSTLPRYTQLRLQGHFEPEHQAQKGRLFAGLDHLPDNRQIERCQQESRLVENETRAAQVHPLSPLRDHG